MSEMKKLTFEQAVSLFKESKDNPENWTYSWLQREHPILGKAKKVDETIDDYNEGAVTTSIIVVFENCDTAIGYTTTTNSWDEYACEDDEPTYWPAKLVMREVWTVITEETKS